MNRWIRHQPPAQFYTPHGVPLGRLRGVTLSLDGMEALRLADAEGLDHGQAAELMGISRPTFSRLLAEARGIVATGLANGWALRIEGGNYEFTDEASFCGRGRRRCRLGSGRGMAPTRQGGSMSADEAGASARKETVSAKESFSEPQPPPAAESPEPFKPR
jgi:predicted DNA-binding protein (UPF0251 family)